MGGKVQIFITLSILTVANILGKKITFISRIQKYEYIVNMQEVLKVGAEHTLCFSFCYFLFFFFFLLEKLFG